jgi:hypothetical protein
MTILLHIEKVAAKVNILKPIFVAVACLSFIIAIISRNKLPTEISFLVAIVMLWSFGLALLSHNFSPRTDTNGNHMPSRVSAVNAEHLRRHQVAFMVIWFVILTFISIVMVGVLLCG